MADDCLTMFDYKIFRGRQIRANRWDGKTKFKVEETEEEQKARIEKFEAALKD